MNILTFTTRGCIKRLEHVHIVYNKKMKTVKSTNNTHFNKTVTLITHTKSNMYSLPLPSCIHDNNGDKSDDNTNQHDCNNC